MQTCVAPIQPPLKGLSECPGPYIEKDTFYSCLEERDLISNVWSVACAMSTIPGDETQSTCPISYLPYRNGASELISVHPIILTLGIQILKQK